MYVEPTCNLIMYTCKRKLVLNGRTLMFSLRHEEARVLVTTVMTVINISTDVNLIVVPTIHCTYIYYSAFDQSVH